MAGDFALGDDFVSEVLCAAARDCAAAVLPGSSVVSLLAERVGVAFCRAAWGWLSGKSAAQQQAAITALAQASVDRVRPAVEAGLAGIACDAETRAQLVTYLTAIPMTARRAITRRTTAGSRRRSSPSCRGTRPTCSGSSRCARRASSRATRSPATTTASRRCSARAASPRCGRRGTRCARTSRR